MSFANSYRYASGGGFIPPDISGNVLWLDGNDTDTMFDAVSGGSNVVLNGDRVLRWEDKSGNDNHATQSSTTSSPDLNTSGLNGLNSLDFANDFYELDLELDSPMTIFIVANVDNFSVGNSPRLLDIVGATYDFQLMGNNEATDTWYTKNNEYQAGLSSTGWSSFTLGTSQVLSIITDMTSTTFYANNTSQVGSVASNMGVGAGTSRIGYRADGNNSTRYSGQMSEIIIYNSTISEPNRGAVQTYLNNKWSIY